ncbi:response regulator transcription factor [Methylocella sp.]|uniref:response regulator transcription factor n=1 Tax=Methylocella sp. TaxID=1978226 RepID=UPI00378411F6
MRYLLVEDDRSIGLLLRRGLEAEGHVVDWTQTGAEATARILLQAYDAVVLDLRLPDVDGMELCARLRAEGAQTPILILSARDQAEDRIKGLNSGADDYLVKPFVFEELLARLAAIHRRSAARRDEVPAPAGELLLDPGSRTVRHEGRIAELTLREFQLLEFLLKNRNKVVSRSAILHQVWGANADVSDNSIDVYVGYLRKKLNISGRLVTVRGVGFRLSS